MPRTDRNALKLGTREPKALLQVTVPHNVDLDGLRHITEQVIINIEKLTGHPCMSGTHDILFTHELENVLAVDLR